MQELVKNGKIEEYWKEATVKLPADEEFTYVVQNKNTNCVLIRNESSAIITAGAKSCSHEVTLPPGNNGVVSRPFPLRYVYLRADKPCAVNLIETVSQDPVGNIVQQEVVHKVKIQNETLKVSQEDAFSPLFIQRTSTAAPLSVTLNLGIFGRPIVNIWVKSDAGGGNFQARFWVLLSNDNITFYPRTSVVLNRANLSSFVIIPDNAFRYVKVETDAANNNTIVIGAIR